MNYPKTILWSGVIAAFCFTGAAYAQSSSVDKDATQTNQVTASQDGALPFNNLLAYNDAAAQQGGEGQDVQSLGTIEATGLLFSMKQSLATEKTATGIVSAVTASDIGQLPSLNVAESISRLPGVNIDYKMPATQRISINGINADLNLSLLNGHRVAQTSWLLTQSASRGFNFSVLPNEMVSSIEIHKTSQASILPGGIGGTILVKTPKPLDAAPNTFAGHVGYLYNSQRSSGAPNFAVFYSTHNASGSFGFDIAASYLENKITRDGAEVLSGWLGVTDATSGYGASPWVVAHTGRYTSATALSNLNSAYFRQDQKRTAISADVQWRPSSNLDLGLRLFHRKNDLSNLNNSVYVWPAQSPANVDWLGNPDADGVVHMGHYSSTACTPTTPLKCGSPHVKMDVQARHSVVVTQGGSLDVGYSSDGWGLDASAGFSSSENTKDDQFGMGWLYGGGFTWNDLAPSVVYDNPSQAANPKYWVYNNSGHHHWPMNVRNNYVKAKIHVDLDGLINKIEFGIHYGNNVTTREKHFHAGTNLTTSGKDLFKTSLADIPGGGKMTSLTTGSDDLAHRVTFGDYSDVRGWIDDNVATDPVSSSIMINGGFWNVAQSRSSFFVQADFDNYDGLRGNFGARLVKVSTDSSSLIGNNVTTPASPNWNTSWFTQSGSTTTVLPAANIAYNPVPSVVLRAGLAQTMGFNGAKALSANRTLSNDTFTGNLGNPGLKPVTSVNTDLSAAWYFSDQGALSVAIFNKNLANYVGNETMTKTYTVPGFLGLSPSDQTRIVTNPTCSVSGDKYTCDYLMQKPVNKNMGKLTGVTLAYSQAYGDSGFGLRTSYTLVDGHATSGALLPYTSRDTYQITPFYAKGAVNASISYAKRSSYVAAGYLASATSNLTQAREQLNVHFGYSINDHWDVALDAINLTNAGYVQVDEANLSELQSIYKNGTSYNVSASFKF